MNQVEIRSINTDVAVEEIHNNVSVKLMPIKTIILALQASPYMPKNPIEGVDLDVDR